MIDFKTVFETILDGTMPEPGVIDFLVDLSDRGETVEQLIAAAAALRARGLAAGPFPDAIDLCGTGGDHSGSVNVSTAAALIVAACGVPVAKHGNRAASSLSGSSDVLQALGVAVQTTADEVALAMKEFGIAFLMAPSFHPALRRLAPLRRQMGRRTIFNLMGPLINPAGVMRQLVGVYSPALLEPFAYVLAALGSKRAWIVHGEGLDEITVTGSSQAVMLENGAITRQTIRPQDYGLRLWTAESLKGGTAPENATALERMLAGEPGAYRDIAVLNAGAALAVSGKVEHLAHGVCLASSCIDSMAALDLLHQLRHKPA